MNTPISQLFASLRAHSRSKSLLFQTPKPTHSRTLKLPKAYSLQPKALAASLLLLTNAAIPSDLTTTHTLDTGTVEIRNTQKRYTWHPVAILFRFTDPATGEIRIIRQSQGTQKILATCAISNHQHIAWYPIAAIPFNENETLIITATATNGTVEIIRKGQ